MHQLIDSHCHIDLLIQHYPLQSILKACEPLGIQHMIIPGLYPNQWPKIQALCEAHQALFFAVGIHPWFRDQVSIHQPDQDKQSIDLFEAVKPYIDHPKCIAIGECGLDAMIQTPLNQQVHLFHQHLEIANYYKKPMIIHSRKTDHLLLQHLKKNPLECPGVRHAFTGSLQQGQALIDHNLYLGIGGSITYPRAQKTRKAAQRLPLKHLVLETDAPDMPLKGFQGQINTPMQLAAVATCLSQLRDTPEDEIIYQTTANCLSLFGQSLQNTMSHTL